jgi:hypothetical protein
MTIWCFKDWEVDGIVECEAKNGNHGRVIVDRLEGAIIFTRVLESYEFSDTFEEASKQAKRNRKRRVAKLQQEIANLANVDLDHPRVVGAEAE